MSVTEISEMHNRYVRLADKFKSIWTYHQFAQGAFKNLLDHELPYNIDFQNVYQPIKNAQSLIQSAQPDSARDLLDRADRDLHRVIAQLIRADEFISASVMRRFFERLDHQDHKIIYYLIKFYFYAAALGDEQIDKIDFLLTRIAEDFIEERGEYAARDSLALRQTFQSLLAVRELDPPSQEELLTVIAGLRDLKAEIEATETFDDLGDRNLVGRLRELKHQHGDCFMHPDALLAIVQANIAMKNQSRSLYVEEEQVILDHAQRLLDNERSLKEGFAASDPSLAVELEKFKKFKQTFDESRAISNLKFDSLSRLKESMKKLIGDFDAETVPRVDPVEPTIEEDVRRSQVERVFGDDPMLNQQLLEITDSLAPWTEQVGSAGHLAEEVVSELRIEKWEAEAWFRLVREESEESALIERDLLFMRAAALRMRINEEAKELVARIEQGHVEENVLTHVRSILMAAERTDGSFGSLLQGVASQWGPDELRRLHRSRIRLFREFSGLWLLYDQYVEENPEEPDRESVSRRYES